MNLNFKTFTIPSLCLLIMGGIVSFSFGSDFSDNVTPDQRLYQRVRQLGGYGLLDEQDKAVLDEGRVVTRLELAFYLEKAKARIEAPRAIPTPLPAVAVPAAEAPSLPPPPAADTPTPVPAAPAPLAPLPMTQPVAPPAPAPAVPAAVKSEIEELLRELRHESAVLRTRLAQDDYRIHQQSDELERLKTVQDDVESAFKKANRSSGSPNFNSASNLRVENISVRGITVVNATKTVEDVNLGMWSDLGGKGSISLGFGGYIPLSNATAGPISIYLFSPKINWAMDGKLGHWDATVAVEAYSADTDLGDFVRGSPPGSNRFELPFEIKKYSTDKSMKNWDDFMTNLGYVPSTTSWVSQSNSSVVFDGFYMLGSNLPLLSRDAKATILLGRMGTSATETQRLEEGLKYSQPWGGGFLQTSLSTLWINEDFGVTAPGTPALDLKTYGADLAFDLNPFFLDLKGGYSQFYSGVDTTNTVIKSFGAPAGQASLSFYPLTLYYSAIDENYANPSSKVIQAGFNMGRFGYANSNTTNNHYGEIGMVDDLISDRHGWRVNLGWKGRQSDWMKDWPSLLDDFIINFDVAQNQEYQMLTDEVGHNVVQAYELITVYYPDDTGLWGNNLWGGYGGLHAIGGAAVTNIMNLRNDGLAAEPYMFVGNGYNQRIPFILPVYASPGVIQTSGGLNVYTQLDHLKTFHYLTLTAKLQFNKMLGLSEPFYGSLFFTDHTVSGVTDGAVAAMPDPNRSGQTLASIPNMFNQRVYDAVLMYQFLKDVNLSADYGLETWKSDYTYPPLNWRTDSFGAGLAYDTPWGAGKFELRYKHLINTDYAIPANNFTADQIYSYFLMKF